MLPAGIRMRKLTHAASFGYNLIELFPTNVSWTVFLNYWNEGFPFACKSPFNAFDQQVLTDYIFSSVHAIPSANQHLFRIVSILMSRTKFDEIHQTVESPQSRRTFVMVNVQTPVPGWLAMTPHCHEPEASFPKFFHRGHTKRQDCPFSCTPVLQFRSWFCICLLSVSGLCNGTSKYVWIWSVLR